MGADFGISVPKSRKALPMAQFCAIIGVLPKNGTESEFESDSESEFESDSDSEFESDSESKSEYESIPASILSGLNGRSINKKTPILPLQLCKCPNWRFLILFLIGILVQRTNS